MLSLKGFDLELIQENKKGPVVIKKGNQEIAIGRKLAEKIVVRKGR